MDMSGIQIKEAEQRALADQALADFAAKEGIALESAANTTGTTKPASEGPVKSMGPQTEKN
jgi:hypothetical protein